MFMSFMLISDAFQTLRNFPSFPNIIDAYKVWLGDAWQLSRFPVWDNLFWY